MGWSHPYTMGVLSGWKLARTYCEAVLSHDQRIALDGAPAEVVDAAAKEPGVAPPASFCPPAQKVSRSLVWHGASTAIIASEKRFAETDCVAGHIGFELRCAK